MSVDIIVHSDETGSAGGSGWSNIICFTSTGDRCNFIERAPAIWYHSAGKLRICSALPEITGNNLWEGLNIYEALYYKDHSIDLNKWYHIEITQEKKYEKVREFN